MTPAEARASLELSLIAPILRDQAIEAFEEGDAIGFCSCCQAGNVDHLEHVARNARALKWRGIYEVALLGALASTRTNNRNVPYAILRALFAIGDRHRFRCASEALPGPGPYTVYRGIAGKRQDRRPRGPSWTGSIQRACWFALRCAHLEQPAVLTATLKADDVVAYLTDRSESEFVAFVRRFRDLKLTLAEMQGMRDAEHEALEQLHRKRVAALQREFFPPIHT